MVMEQMADEQLILNAGGYLVNCFCRCLGWDVCFHKGFDCAGTNSVSNSWTRQCQVGIAHVHVHPLPTCGVCGLSLRGILASTVDPEARGNQPAWQPPFHQIRDGAHLLAHACSTMVLGLHMGARLTSTWMELV